MNPLYKYQNFDPNNIRSMNRLHTLLETNCLHCSAYNEMNDPMEGAFEYFETHDEKIRHTIEEIRYGKNMVRICCLTRSYQHNLMWAYYGGGHTGICIEVDDICEPMNNYKRFNIRYTNQKPCISSLMSETEAIEKILSTKSKQWKHEQEVRYLVNKGDTLHVHIKRIFAGCKMTKKNFETLQELINNVNRCFLNDKIELVKLDKNQIDYGWE